MLWGGSLCALHPAVHGGDHLPCLLITAGGTALGEEGRPAPRYPHLHPHTLAPEPCCPKTAFTIQQQYFGTGFREAQRLSCVTGQASTSLKTALIYELCCLYTAVLFFQIRAFYPFVRQMCPLLCLVSPSARQVIQPSFHRTSQEPRCLWVGGQHSPDSQKT